jgi:hypothetical protein
LDPEFFAKLLGHVVGRYILVLSPLDVVPQVDGAGTGKDDDAGTSRPAIVAFLVQDSNYVKVSASEIDGRWIVASPFLLLFVGPFTARSLQP